MTPARRRLLETAANNGGTIRAWHTRGNHTELWRAWKDGHFQRSIASDGGWVWTLTDTGQQALNEAS